MTDLEKELHEIQVQYDKCLKKKCDLANELDEIKNDLKTAEVLFTCYKSKKCADDSKCFDCKYHVLHYSEFMRIFGKYMD